MRLTLVRNIILVLWNGRLCRRKCCLKACERRGCILSRRVVFMIELVGLEGLLVVLGLPVEGEARGIRGEEVANRQ